MHNQALLSSALSSFEQPPAKMQESSDDKVDLGLINKFAYELGSSGINIGP